MDHAALSPVHVSVVIPTHDTRHLTLACVESVLAAGAAERTAHFEVIVVDDASGDGTEAALRALGERVRVLRNDRARGFAESANRGLAAARGEILLLLNSDTEVAPEALEVLAEVLRRDSRLGIVGATLRYPDGTPQWSGGSAPSLLWLFGLASGLPALLGRLPGARIIRPVRGASGGEVDWVPGAAMGIRRRAWEEVGPLDETFHLYCQDLDLCLRAREVGWGVSVAPAFRVVHHHGATIGRRAGSAGPRKPDLLWSDLVRWGRKHRGPSWARKAVLALAVGGRLRLVARWLGGLLRAGTAREAWRRDSVAYRRALGSLRAEMRDTGSVPPLPEKPETDGLTRR